MRAFVGEIDSYSKDGFSLSDAEGARSYLFVIARKNGDAHKIIADFSHYVLDIVRMGVFRNELLKSEQY